MTSRTSKLKCRCVAPEGSLEDFILRRLISSPWMHSAELQRPSAKAQVLSQLQRALLGLSIYSFGRDLFDFISRNYVLFDFATTFGRLVQTSNMRAIQSVELGKAVITDIPEPELKPDSILVRPLYVGNNPCDWLVTDFDFVFTKNQIIGCDYCGVVEKIGSDVKTELKPGDKVTGAVAGGVGCDITRGAFAEKILAYGEFIFPLPKNVKEVEAATLGVGVSTIAVAFYEHFGLPSPEENPTFGQGKPFFIYGGSSAMGLFGIQYAKLSGFRVVTTCSPKNFDLVKSFGADDVYDYHDMDRCAKDIKQSVGDELHYAYICVTDENEPKVGYHKCGTCWLT